VLNELFTISPDKYYAYSWIELFNPTDHTIPWLDDVFPINTYALGSGGSLIHTEELDAGEWTTVVQPSGQTYNNLDYYFPDTAFACGNGGLLQKITNDTLGNYTVQDLVSGTTGNIYDCQFAYLNNVGYMVGAGGEIRRSLNRGATWTPQTSGVTTALRSLAFVEFGVPPRIWTCGDAGKILRKAGGVAWTIQTVPADKAALNFYGIAFVTDTGFVVGEQGAILVTRNGGTNWVSKPSAVTTTLRSVFTAENTTSFKLGRAWVVGDNGVIIRTDDYGETWTQQFSGTSAKLNKVIFGDSIRGAVFGDGGTLLNTTDGGNSWHAQNSGTTENLVAAATLPLTITVENYYVMEMIAKRKTFFFDPVTFTINYDFFTKIDTGLILYDPQLLFNLRVAPKPKDIPQYSFIILNSDSVRFKDHVKLGPGQTQLQNVSIAFQPDTVFHPVLWDLLAAGEIRLVKYYIKQTTAKPPKFLGFERKVIDLIRYGNFMPTTAYYPPNEIYPNNKPLGFIPEGYSIARYANDGGGLPADQQSTAYSYYLASDPIPGWFSQESRP
jgi:photosystem II stability/assembly factor-like uncharacterized protein